MAEPTVLIVGGPNGAGKTPLADPCAEQQDLPYLAADRIAKELNPEDPYAARREAGRRFLRRLDAFIENRASFVVESTRAGRELARHVDRMSKVEYTTRIAFVFLDSVDLCVRRVQERVRKEGGYGSGRGHPAPLHAEQGEFLDVIPPEGGPMAPPF